MSKVSRISLISNNTHCTMDGCVPNAMSRAQAGRQFEAWALRRRRHHSTSGNRRAPFSRRHQLQPEILHMATRHAIRDS